MRFLAQTCNIVTKLEMHFKCTVPFAFASQGKQHFQQRSWMGCMLPTQQPAPRAASPLAPPTEVSAGIAMPTILTTRYPGLCSLLLSYLKLVAKLPPDFFVTTIQITKNMKSQPLVDKNNLGPSFLICLGKYKGCKTWVERRGGSKKHVLKKTVMAKRYVKGRCVRGDAKALVLLLSITR